MTVLFCHPIINAVDYVEVLQNKTEMSLLHDFYGALLSARQREALDLYLNEDMTQAEVALSLSISRQAAFDLQKHALKALAAYEAKLGLVNRFMTIKKALLHLESSLSNMTDEQRSWLGIIKAAL